MIIISFAFYSLNELVLETEKVRAQILLVLSPHMIQRSEILRLQRKIVKVLRVSQKAPNKQYYMYCENRSPINNIPLEQTGNFKVTTNDNA